MRIITSVSYWANFYFFIQNLSSWHRSVRVEYNDAWIDRIGKVNNDERRALKRFADIRSRFKQGRSIFELAFFLQDDPFIFLKNKLHEKDFLFLKKLFEIFSNRFNQIYDAEKKQFIVWKDILKEEFSDLIKIDEIHYQLSKLLGNCFIKNEVEIFLLLSAGNRCGGGSNIDQNSISIELSGTSKEKKNLIMGVIWHELIHLKWQNVVLHDLLVDMLGGDMTEVALMNEMIISTLFPRGILGKKYYDIELPNKFGFSNDMQKNREIFKLMEEYINSGRQVDRDLITLIKNIHRKRPGIS